jgi:superfamily II DNA or RNA helicase
MRIIIGNIQSQAIIGGKDNLLPFKLIKLLSEYLSVDVKGAHWARKANPGSKWSGIRYFINTDGFFATGFLPMVLKYMDELGVPHVDIEDTRTVIPEFYEDFESFIGKIKNEETGVIEDWWLRDYQGALVHKVDNYIEFRGRSFYFPRGIIDAATNAGKNSIMAAITKNVVNGKALMLVHSTDIFKQAYKFFSQIFYTGRIDAKHYEIGVFTIAMQKTLLARCTKSTNVRADLNKFNILFCDEAHNSGGADYSKLLTYVNAPVRVFVSGSPLDSSNVINNMIIVGLSGPIIGKITKKELQDMGVSLKMIVHIMICNEKRLVFDYGTAQDALIFYSKRRVENMILWLSTRRDKFTLVAFDIIAHGEFIYESFLKAPELDGLVIELVHGQDPLRAEKIAAFKRGDINILIGSTIMQEGLNIPIINCLIYAIAGMAKIPIKQFGGRIERNDGVNEYVETLDFYDVGKYVQTHARKRIQTYRAEGFEMVYHYEPTPKGYPKIFQVL